MARISVETSGHSDVDERRRFERTELIVRVEYATVDDLFSEFTRDINEGGVFIETTEPQELGTAVAMQFHLAGADEPVKTSGIVVRVSDGSDGGTAGMGVEFENLPPDAREQIDRMIKSLKQ
jgi:uncharacterized protein (TIGR02266 family)